MKAADKRRKKAALYELQKGICAHCGKPMPPLESNAGLTRRATIEHVIPKSQGGTDAWSNLLVVHGHCNHRRDVKPLHLRAKEMHRYVTVAVAAQRDLKA